MGPLRNREIQTELILDAAISVALGVIGLLLSPAAGALLLLLGVLLSGLHLWLGVRRYRRIEALSNAIDRILHGQEQLLIAQNDEGELAILNSEIRKMTMRLKEQTDLLRREKLRLTDAIADIFHQVRTPLTAINLIITLLNEHDLPFEERRELTRELKKQTDRIRWLVETLLKLSKLDAGAVAFRSETLSARALIDAAAEPFRIGMELREQTLLLRIGDEKLTCDRQWTIEAIGNLLKNCMEHTPRGGSICIEANETPLFTELTITDSGEGFDREDIPHLFERFYKGRNAVKESIGIGLAFSREVLAAQDGVLTAQNASEGGARFTVRFYKSTV